MPIPERNPPQAPSRSTRFLASLRQSWPKWLLIATLIVLIILPRLTALNQYLIVDEADRWRWATEFVQALNRGDLAGTLVGDGYPGIVPVWAESIWILLEAGRRSVVEGQWIGDIGLGHLLHEWDRTGLLYQQRLPIVLLNTALALAIVWTVWRLFGARVAIVSGVLIALDPFYLSDSRVNRAEAVITGFMTLSVLSLVCFYQRRQFRFVIISGVLGGLSFLTKIQALSILPVVALTGLLIFWGDRQNTDTESNRPWRSILKFGAGWGGAASLTWFLLWPSMWVTPVETLSLVYYYTTRKVGAEGVSLFFMGKTYQDTDPGLLFYPIVFLMRITPLALLGLMGALLRVALNVFRTSFAASRSKLDQTFSHSTKDPFTSKGTFILVIYVLLYAVVMTIGSHKQDRYLMPVFLGLDILAAMGLVYISYRLSIITLKFEKWGWILLSGLVAVQLATILPHHPYYYSYFNPLFGGGHTAVRTLRIGWGEGMDQVGRYLATKPNDRELVVSTRFTHNMLDFQGEVIALGEDGRWTQADYVVLYIQQVQRRLDPSPGFIDYFQARLPEKVVTLGGIDYAWIYPIPFTTPANPRVSLLPGEAALFGYSWEPDSPAIRLLWKNLGIATDRRLLSRLLGSQAETDWAECIADATFSTQARTSGAFVESLCAVTVDSLPPGTYSVEFGLSSPATGRFDTFLFPEGWQAARVTSSREVEDTLELERLEAIAAEFLPAEAVPLDRIYDARLRLAAYRLEPIQPRPGQSVKLTLYWQAAKEVQEPLDLTVQLTDSRLISLGRSDIALVPSLHDDGNRSWLPGEVQVTRHNFDLGAELSPPLAGRVEVSLRDEAEILLQPNNSSGQPLDIGIDYFTVAPHQWPTLAGVTVVEADWQNDITLRGYRLPATSAQPGGSLRVSLFWQTGQSIADNYMIFVHLVDETAHIVTQNDSLPRAGAYPTPWWQPGVLIEDSHPLDLPRDIPPGKYQLIVGLYGVANNVRLSLTDGGDSLVIGTIEIQ